MRIGYVWVVLLGLLSGEMPTRVVTASYSPTVKALVPSNGSMNTQMRSASTERSAAGHARRQSGPVVVLGRVAPEALAGHELARVHAV